MGTKYAFLLFLAFAFSAQADEWTGEQKIAEASYFALAAVDWRQTQDIRRHQGLFESNPILGRNPSNAKINTWFISSNVVQFLIADALSDDLRSAWIASGIVIEVSMVKHNKSAGVHFKF
jgi:hypothetical protein